MVDRSLEYWKFENLNYMDNGPSSPSPLAGEGAGEGEHFLSTPTLVLPRQGGG